MKIKLVVGAIVALCFVAGISVRAEEQKIIGKGNVGGFIPIFSEDILLLENEIKHLMSECGRELNQ